MGRTRRTRTQCVISVADKAHCALADFSAKLKRRPRAQQLNNATPPRNVAKRHESRIVVGICIDRKARTAGTVAAVKKILCCLMIAWLTFGSLSASAHAVSDVAHMAGHTAVDNPTAFGAPTQTLPAQDGIPDSATAETQSASPTETCNQTHCGHGHAIAILEACDAFAYASVATGLPATRQSDTSYTIATAIERPNWLATTSVVVSLSS